MELFSAQVFNSHSIGLSGFDQHSGEVFKTDVKKAFEEMNLDVPPMQHIAMSREILSSLGERSLDIGGPVGLGISGSIGIAGGLMGSSGGLAYGKLNKLIGDNIEKLMDGQRQFEKSIYDLKIGQNILKSVGDIHEGQEDIKFSMLLSDKGITSKDGWSLIAN